MSNSRLRVLSSLSAFPQVTKNSSELERVGSKESGSWCGDVIANMVGCEKPDLSDDSSLSTVSSEELDIMGSDSEGRGRGEVNKRKSKDNDIFLACHEDKFPSDSEEEKRDVGRGRGRRIDRGMGVDVSVIVGGSRRGRPSSLSKMGVPGWFGVGGGGQKDPASQYHPRLGKPTLFTVPRRGDSPPVPLGGFKSTTLSRVNPGLSASLIEGSGIFEPRKRKPRLDASLKICSNFVNDVLSRKHKGWVWPLYKPDRGNDAVFRDPIYLVDIKMKLADRKYNRPEEFAADMRKLIGNYCRYYNVNHQYHQSAKQLQGLFENEFKKVQEVGDGSKWGAEVRGKRFKECVVGGTQVSTPVPASTPLVVSVAGVEGGVGKKGVGVSKLKGASLSVWVPGGSDGKGASPVGSSDSFVEEKEEEVGSGSEVRKDGVGGSPNVIAESMMNATLSALKVEASEEMVGAEDLERDEITNGRNVGEGSSGVETCGDQDERVVVAVKRGVDALEGSEEVGGGKRMKVGEGDASVRVCEHADATTTKPDVKIKPVCKWILDGFNSVPENEQESLLREIRGAVGIEQLDMEGVVLGTLLPEELSVVASVIVGALTGVRDKRKCEEREFEGKGLKVANEVITSSQSDWHKMEQDLSSIRDTTYATLIKINHMQEFSFESLKNLHSRKNDLTK